MDVVQLQALAACGDLVGIFDGIPSEVYHHPACPGISKSDLDLIRRSIHHYNSKGLMQKEERSKALIIGSAIHDRILLPDLFQSQYCEEPIGIDKRTKAGKEEWAEWQSMNAGKIPLSAMDMAMIEDMAEQVLTHPICKEIFKGAKFEQTIFWRDPETGILCKCRPDIIREDGIIADLKSCIDASLNQFRRSIVNYSYDKQAAYYLEGASQALGRKYENFIFICIEKEIPHGVALYNANEAILEAGKALFRQDLELFREGRNPQKDHRWGYPIEIQDIDMAAFGFALNDR